MDVPEEKPKSLPPPGFFPGEESELERGPTLPSTPSSAEAMAAWAGDDSVGAIRAARPSSRHFAAAAMKGAAADLARFRESGDWGDATARHFVALHEQLHLEVYGIALTEMTTKERQQAAFLAGKVLKEEFGGDPAEMAEFMRWAWLDREASREKWRRDNGKSGGRLGWRLLFGAIVSDYRLDVMRRKPKR